MDSFNLLCSISNCIPSNRRSKKEVSTLVQSNRTKFLATYKCQSFSLPDSIMLYIAKNPTSSEVYQKLVQSCKDFFVKNPILVTSELCYSCFGYWQLSYKHRPIDLSKITSKLWITDRLEIQRGSFINEKAVNQNILSSTMPNLHHCDAKYIEIWNQAISYDDLSLLVSSAEKIRFHDVTVKHDDGSNVALEKIVEVVVKAKNIEIHSLSTLLNITSNTMKELIKLPHFLTLHKLKMKGIPEAFDIETFYSYMKKNRITRFKLYFDDSISETYKNRLEEIEEMDFPDFMPVIFGFTMAV